MRRNTSGDALWKLFFKKIFKGKEEGQVGWGFVRNLIKGPQPKIYETL
jgi:hypothetical protein